MARLKPVATLTFSAELCTHGTWGARGQGNHESTMELYFREDATGWIDWENPVQEEGIGLWFSISPQGLRTLTEYDGVMALPVQCCDILRAAGVVVPFEFDDRFEAFDELLTEVGQLRDIKGPDKDTALARAYRAAAGQDE